MKITKQQTQKKERFNKDKWTKIKPDRGYEQSSEAPFYGTGKVIGLEDRGTGWITIRCSYQQKDMIKALKAKTKWNGNEWMLKKDDLHQAINELRENGWSVVLEPAMNIVWAKAIQKEGA